MMNHYGDRSTKRVTAAEADDIVDALAYLICAVADDARVQPGKIAKKINPTVFANLYSCVRAEKWNPGRS